MKSFDILTAMSVVSGRLLTSPEGEYDSGLCKVKRMVAELRGGSDCGTLGLLDVNKERKMILDKYPSLDIDVKPFCDMYIVDGKYDYKGMRKALVAYGLPILVELA